jgi:hypothetical protein
MYLKYRWSATLALALFGIATNVLAQTAPRYEDLRPLGGEWSAADTIGAAVRSADGAEVGEIRDLILSSDAKVVTAVVSVGGFIGIADKLVAVPYGDLRVWSDDESLAVALTSAELGSAPKYGASPRVGDSEPVVDPAKAEPPSAEIRREAEEEATRAFAGDDPRVADGIAENKKAYEDGEAEEADEAEEDARPAPGR